MSFPLDPKFQNEHLDAKIVAGLERIYEAYRVLLSKVAHKHKLSPIQVQLLIFIKGHSPQQNTLSYLAREFSLTKATLSQSVKTLWSKGLIIKVANPDDSRSQHLCLSDEGEALVHQLQDFSQLLHQPIQQMPSHQQHQLWEGLSDIIFNLQRNGAVTLQRMCFNCNWYQPKSGGHYCKLLQTDLEKHDIRIDCPEHSSVLN